MNRSYENALKLLGSTRRKTRPKNPAAAIPIPQDATTTLRGVPSLVGMKEWLQALGHSDTDISSLNIIHITGTKGKGSTCAFTRSFLHAHSLRTGFPKRIGVYTSPDLQGIRERIQIDGRPITEGLFTRYFYEVWECLQPADDTARKPRYLQFLALLAFHTFIKERVEAAIFETHHGGEYDATNVIAHPVATGITSLGMDHVEELGPTIENIAWHKSGIFKRGAPAFTVPQDAGPAEVMRGRAKEKGTALEFVATDENYLPANNRALSVPVQRLNCSLALELAKAFLQARAPGNTINDADLPRGVDGFSWPGRFEVLEDAESQSQWFVDGAHNVLSLQQTAEWFVKNTNEQKRCILIFSHFSENRDGPELMDCVSRALRDLNTLPSHVIFTTYQEREDGTTRIDKTLKVPETPFPDYCAIYSSLWKDFDPQASVSSEPTIEGAIKSARRITAQEGGGMQVLVTGSLHLVGGALNILRP